VIHCIAPDNAASQAVARRLGSEPLRSTNLPAPFEAMQVDVWGQSRARWQQRRQAEGRSVSVVAAPRGGSNA
jgi:RimJ/RimL family protein N-acetyltransferase